MKVIICGAGQVGWQIARHLSGENNDVTVVDNNPDLVRRAAETLDVQGLTGFASYPDVLDKAGARDAAMIIAATHSDEVNMVTCQVAHSVFDIRRKIARLRSQSYLDAIYSDLYRRDHLPIDVVISPEKEVAQAAMQRLAAPAAFDTELFLDGEAQLMGLRLGEDCPVLNTSLRQLTELFSTLRVVVVGVRRNGKLFAPDADDELQAGDEAYVFSPVDDIPRTLEVFGKSSHVQERLVINGGGNIGLAVAQALEQRGRKIKTKGIERERKCAERAADLLERTIVLNGDGLDSVLLAEANVARADAILAVTDDDNTNMLAAVRAKAEGCVSSFLRHIRLGRVRSVYSVGDAEAEMIEAEVLSTSSIAGVEIRDIGFPEGVLVAGVRKGDEIVKPTGRTKLQAGDVVVMFSLAADVAQVEQLLQVAIDFF